MADQERQMESERLRQLQRQLKCADALRVFGILVFVIGLILTVYGSAYCTWYYWYTYCDYSYYDQTYVIVGCIMMVVGIVIMVISGGMHRSLYQQLPAHCRGRFMVRVIETTTVPSDVYGNTYNSPTVITTEGSAYSQQQYYQQTAYPQQGYPAQGYQQYPAYPQQQGQQPYYPPAYDQAMSSDGNANQQTNYKQAL